MPSVQSRAAANLFRSAVTRPFTLQRGYSSRYNSVQPRTLASLTHRHLPLTPRNLTLTTFTRNMSSSSAAAKRLHGKTILITGASSGIGRSTALEFARTNPSGDLRLIITARRKESLEELAAQIREETKDGVKVLPVQLDVSKAEEIRGFVGGLPEEWRDIHVLVNNAGLVKGVAKAPEIAEEDMNIMFTTNVTGLINMTQAILPIFQKRPDGGQGDIINIGSIAGREPYPGGSIYCATKAAVRSFTEALRKELIATRIRVIEVDPGQVQTEFSVVRFYGDKAKADAVYAGCDPLTPDDVAEVVVFAATRRENVVVADTLLFPNHQASALIMHRRPT
ncbi:NAD(P)-binding protein [Trichoderma longibrachiatum]|uniref:NAD(P)-binding protein n=1 Tax=Trichoderma longibrachiatum ATCC 18648 TaxID=983965 RepID=A0A2T4CGW8_TRILO|nr:NAD(P)-binding protein [Trichoderma longibrachiatum ATCC 18648]